MFEANKGLTAHIVFECPLKRFTSFCYKFNIQNFIYCKVFQTFSKSNKPKSFSAEAKI